MSVDAQRMELFERLRRPDHNRIPKYQRLANVLLDAIKRGLWRPGDRLPAEEELAGLTPFSLGTVQRALRDLADQGLVVRQHGLGSFVAEKPRRLQDPWHCRFLGDDGLGILPIYSKAIQRVAVTEEGSWTRYLRAHGGNVMRLDRVIDVNDEFRIFSRFYADRHLLKRLWEMPMERLHGANFKEIITTQCKLPITDITHLVRLDVFDAEACAVIQAAAGTTGLHMQAIAHAGREVRVYYQEFYILQNRRALQFVERTQCSMPSGGSVA